MDAMTQEQIEQALAGIRLSPKIVTGDPRSLSLLKVNARFMRHETFQRLVGNIRRDGVLTSTPFVWTAHAVDPDGKDSGYRDGELVVLSGNHRVEASIEAGLEEITWLQEDQNLTHDQRVAIQLSHNALEGEDDPAVLKALYESIEGVDWKQYAALDDAHLDLLAEVDFSSLKAANLEFQTLAWTFLPGDFDKAMEAFKEAATLAGKADAKWLARYEDHWRALDAVASASAAFDVTNQAAALTYVLDVFERHRTDLAEGYTDEKGEAKDNRWVPLSTVLNTDSVPAPVAVLLNRMIESMIGKDELSPKARWQALELLAADYLAG